MSIVFCKPVDIRWISWAWVARKWSARKWIFTGLVSTLKAYILSYPFAWILHIVLPGLSHISTSSWQSCLSQWLFHASPAQNMPVHTGTGPERWTDVISCKPLKVRNCSFKLRCSSSTFPFLFWIVHNRCFMHFKPLFYPFFWNNTSTIQKQYNKETINNITTIMLLHKYTVNHLKTPRFGCFIHKLSTFCHSGFRTTDRRPSRRAYLKQKFDSYNQKQNLLRNFIKHRSESSLIWSSSYTLHVYKTCIFNLNICEHQVKIIRNTPPPPPPPPYNVAHGWNF